MSVTSLCDTLCFCAFPLFCHLIMDHNVFDIVIFYPQGQADVRTCFLKFYIAFFIFGDLNAVKEVLELQGNHFFLLDTVFVVFQSFSTCN